LAALLQSENPSVAKDDFWDALLNNLQQKILPEVGEYNNQSRKYFSPLFFFPKNKVFEK